jgi:maltose alpha-D-glucosyltransferase/alpha-amylase
VCENRIHAVRIRHHGDYHLGQVLYTGEDFVIIDFEGEPARPLDERRMKRAAMRDVAGMIRSFQYAAYSAIRNRAGVPETADAWAGFWTAWVSRAFAEAYFGSAAGRPFLPDDESERKLLFDVFVLEKALYEVAYELNNRPDWVGIPLRGIVAVTA